MWYSFNYHSPYVFNAWNEMTKNHVQKMSLKNLNKFSIISFIIKVSHMLRIVTCGILLLLTSHLEASLHRPFIPLDLVDSFHFVKIIKSYFCFICFICYKFHLNSTTIEYFFDISNSLVRGFDYLIKRWIYHL